MKRTGEQLLLITDQILEHWWAKDVEFMFPYLHKDTVWIGATSKDYISGEDAFIKHALILKNEISVCKLTEQKYQIVYYDKTACIICGSYIASTYPSSGELLSDQQRFTYVWKYIKDEWKLLTVHISNPIGFMDDQEYFPRKIGQISYQYFMHLLKSEKDNSKRFVFKDIDGNINIVYEFEILYIEAQNANCSICTLSDKICVHESLSQIEKKLSDSFVRTHRSYIVNKAHVSKVKAYDVILSNHEELPIPKNKYNVIKKQLTKKEGGVIE